MDIVAAAEALHVPQAVDLAAIVIGALTGGLLAAREGFAVSGVLLLAVSGGLGGGLIRDVLLAEGPPVALTNEAYLPTVAITAPLTTPCSASRAATRSYRARPSSTRPAIRSSRPENSSSTPSR